MRRGRAPPLRKTRERDERGTQRRDGSNHGEMAEWLKAADSKSVVGATPPGVQIPLSPPDRGEMPERLKGHDWKSCVSSKGVPWVQIPLSPPRIRAAPRRVVAGPRAMEFREPRQVRKEAAVAGDSMCRGQSGCHPWRGERRSRPVLSVNGTLQRARASGAPASRFGGGAPQKSHFLRGGELEQPPEET